MIWHASHLSAAKVACASLLRPQAMGLTKARGTLWDRNAPWSKRSDVCMRPLALVAERLRCGSVRSVPFLRRRVYIPMIPYCAGECRTGRMSYELWMPSIADPRVEASKGAPGRRSHPLTASEPS